MVERVQHDFNEDNLETTNENEQTGTRQFDKEEFAIAMQTNLIWTNPNE